MRALTFCIINYLCTVFYHDSFTPESLLGSDLDRLLELGWYRMHQSMFTTSHVDLGDLYRVHWLRYHVPSITEHRSHKRLLRKHRFFSFQIEDFNGIRADHVELHARYRASIDFDGALSIQECLFGDEPTTANIFNTKTISVFDGDRLVAGGYFDLGETTGASILNFFDPYYQHFSLGRYMILLTIQYLKEHGYDWYYPGYVVEGLSKMDYKLFLGREEAQYFDPHSLTWRKFHEEILVRQSQDEIIALLKRAGQKNEESSN